MRSLSLVVCGILLTLGANAQGQFERYFTESTMRLDYFHTGTKGEERFSLDRVYDDGAWPGSRTQLLDPLNLGEYLVRVYDRATNTLIYSRGYSTIFNEWQTTDEAAAGVFRTFEETVRFPYPRTAVQVSIARRDKRMVFRELFSTTIDPGDPTAVVRGKRSAPFTVRPLMQNGPPAEKVDIAILGDGYAKGDLEKFRRDADHVTAVMFGTRPFRSARKISTSGPSR